LNQCLVWYSEHGISIFKKILFVSQFTIMWVLLSFWVLLGLCNTFPNSKRHVIEPKGFMGYLKRGNACELNTSGHEQYLSNNSNQNNWAHGVCRLPQIRYCFPCRFKQYPYKFQKICDEAQKIFYIPWENYCISIE
jgi:hypothetical protein